ncbi:hypothetical protein HPU229336_05255 [Helicobacter pullorum]|uniref:Uncharacterized protein n=1 Tax=Helicobacter pullorum TaxID=35818 RepID=A0AAW3J854_9HELI|nr:hypothetical protein [Helicobacter pullorum]KPH49986.1 hypothetical protein HPU229336_05255 [Helicobacter pullorum]
MKTSIKYSILIILTFFNIQFLYILTFIPFPFFGWITLFILSCIWVYLFLRFCVWSINRIFKKNIRVKKLYLALPYPLIMLSWFGFSFVPLEWQPSFREFERLCRENDSKEVVYNLDLKKKLYTSNKYPKEKVNIKRINYRLIEKEVFWYDRDSGELFLKFYSYYWTDIGMIPHYEREMICPDIQKYRAIQHKRWWLK